MKIKFMIKYWGLMLSSLIVLGYTGQAKSQLLNQKTASPPAGNGAVGKTLSQWIDRTPIISQSSAWPAASEDCASIYDPIQHRIVLFGGKNDEDRNMNEVWMLDLAKNKWQKIEAGNEIPPTSEDHAVIYDPIGYRMILHGGEDGLTTNKTWAFDLKTHRWRNMTPQSGAPAREDHTAIFDSRGKRMVIFGGRNQDSTYDHINIHEIWALDLDPNSPSFEKWQNLTLEEKHPLGRSDHVAVYDSLKNRMIIYGGWDKEQKEYLGDTWAFDFDKPADSKSRWRQIKTKNSHPPKRRHAVGVYDSARNWFIVCGGFGEEGYLNDVWTFDLTADVWINVTPGPPPRIDHQAIYDPQSQRLILYGGDAGFKGKLHDLWELQIQRGAPSDSLR
jgi:hypothetical protein